MYTRIVVGTDGSDRSLIAVNRAAQIAERWEAELHVVSAAAPMSMGGDPGGTSALDAMRFSDSSARVAARLGHDVCVARRIEVIEHTVVGEPASVLMAIAEEVGADLIVVGNRGMTGKLRLFTGSVPNRVAHHAEVDVLIVSTD
jgi:nucleotide-binding universal stress UspA family protein